ncbi:MAG: hypothetical protein M3179_00110 [Actinomycetota bacterium]|nr:hypothetical protein [Actinomycetota bacterium]
MGGSWIRGTTKTGTGGWRLVLVAAWLAAPLAVAGPAPAAGGDIVTFAVTGLNAPRDITAGADGALWLTGQDSDNIGRPR